jgi:hypothetical protein
MPADGRVRVLPLEPNTPTTSESGLVVETGAAVMKCESAEYLPETASIGASWSTLPKPRIPPAAPTVVEKCQSCARPG